MAPLEIAGLEVVAGAEEEEALAVEGVEALWEEALRFDGILCAEKRITTCLWGRLDLDEWSEGDEIRVEAFLTTLQLQK